MRRAPLAAAVCALLASTPPPAGAAPPYADTVLAEPALAGFWAFNEPAGPQTADLRTSGAGLHQGGVHAGAAPLVPGGRSARYDGRTGATVVPNSPALNPTAAVSLEVWTRPDAVANAATLAGKPGQYAIGFTRAGRAVLRLWARGRVRRLATAPGAVRAGRTVHLVGTFDGRTERLYLNGAARARRALAGALDKTAQPIVLGGGLRGRLDDVAVYRAALPRAAVAAHHAAGLGRRCPDVDLRVGLGAPWRPACWRPYLDGSAFDQPLRPGAPLAPDSAAVVARLAARGPPQMIYGLPSATSDPAWASGDYQHPLYTASWIDRASRVRCLRYACPELSPSSRTRPATSTTSGRSAGRAASRPRCPATGARSARAPADAPGPPTTSPTGSARTRPRRTSAWPPGSCGRRSCSPARSTTRCSWSSTAPTASSRRPEGSGSPVRGTPRRRRSARGCASTTATRLSTASTRRRGRRPSCGRWRATAATSVTPAPRRTPPSRSRSSRARRTRASSPPTMSAAS
ncbi:MAG: hypothetical protein E6G10_01770, partial [Actinobacteria bacterium]